MRAWATFCAGALAGFLAAADGICFSLSAMAGDSNPLSVRPPSAVGQYRPAYLSAMMWDSARRTTGMAKYIVGAAITQAIIHEPNHILNMVQSQPRIRQVATPVTRKVMMKLVPMGRQNWWRR